MLHIDSVQAGRAGLGGGGLNCGFELNDRRLNERRISKLVYPQPLRIPWTPLMGGGKGLIGCFSMASEESSSLSEGLSNSRRDFVTPGPPRDCRAECREIWIATQDQSRRGEARGLLDHPKGAKEHVMPLSITSSQTGFFMLRLNGCGRSWSTWPTGLRGGPVGKV